MMKMSKRVSCLRFFGALICVSTLFASWSVFATDHYVTSDADDGGDGTLRAVIAAAATGDTIYVPEGYFITVFDQLDLSDKALNIIGQGNGITICGSGTNRLLYAASNAYNRPDRPVYLANMTLTNGVAPANGNGGAFINGTVKSTFTVILDNCRVVGNYSGSYGGAFYNTTCRFAMTNCTFYGNTSALGGGVFGVSAYNTSNPIIASNCWFEANAANWLYDPSAGTISDGEWTFTNVTATATDLAVGACHANGHPPEFSTLDFSKPVTNATGASFTIKSLGTLFGKTSDYWKPGSVTTQTGTNLCELVLPATGLVSIGDGAFGGCLNLTNVVNFIPDSVTSVGQAVFYGSGVRQDLCLRGISSIGRCAFTGTGIKSVEFGPNLKTVGNNSNKQGAFQGCSSLTNIVFDPRGNNIVLERYSFSAAATLAQPLILHGVTNINSDAFSKNTKFKSVTFDDGIVNISGCFPLESNNNLLTEVRFLGTPPASLNLTYSGATKKVKTYIRRRHADAWTSYAEGGILNMQDSTFSTALCTTYSTTPALRPLLIEDKLVGTTVVVR